MVDQLLRPYRENAELISSIEIVPHTIGDTPSIYMIEKIIQDSGGLGGVIAAQIPVAGITSDLRNIGSGVGITIALLRSDGQALAVISPNGDTSSTYQSPLRAPDAPVGSTAEDTLDRLVKKFGFRALSPLPGFPLSVMAAVPDSLVLGNWYDHVATTAWITLSLAALVIALTVGVMRLMREQAASSAGLRHQFMLRLQAQASLHRLNDDLEERIAERTQALSRSVTELEKEVRERAFAESTLKQTNELLDAVVRSSPLAIVSLDHQGKVTTWSTGAERVFDFTAEEAVGGPDPSLLDADNPGLISAHAMLSGDSLKQGIDGVRKRKDGSSISVRVAGAPLHNADGEYRGVVLNIEDLTAIKVAQARVELAQRMEAIGQLTGGIAHDFNNLLSVVIGNLEIAIDARPDGEVGELMVFALRASERAAELTHRLLAFARRQRLAPKSVLPGELIDDVRPLIDRTLGAEIGISVHVDQDTWPIFIDPGELENVLINLAINARDAMPRGGHLTIEATNRTINADSGEHGADASRKLFGEIPDGDYVRIIVSDTGTGIPPEILHRVFEPFFTTKETGKGSGLGLSMALGFAQQSGGTIRIYSELNAGTAVQLYLPRSAEGRIDNLVSGPEEAVEPGGRETVLLVEDNPGVRGVAELILSGLGYTVRTAETGADAATMLADGFRPELLFTDIVLPGGTTGPELAAAAQAICPSIRILFCSGYSFQLLHQSGRTPPGISFLSKPFHKKELATAVRQVLDAQPARA